MRFRTLAVALCVTVLTGCKDQKQARQDEINQLTADLINAGAAYRAACLDVSSAVTRNSVNDGLLDTTPAEHQAHARQAQAEAQQRLASPACKAASAKSAAIGARLDALSRPQ